MIVVFGAVASTGTEAPVAYFAPQFGGGSGGETEPEPTGSGILTFLRRRRRRRKS